MKTDVHKPIGVFDSGIGGLTVAKAIRDLLPNEQLIYFGDTAHLPYGDKSEAAVQAFSIKIADVLLQRNCKVIVIACNSASSAAYELLKEYVGKRTKVINVIDPMVNHIKANFSNANIGLIGTKRTIESNVYRAKIDTLQGINLSSLATPLLVPMIEEGFFNDKISKEIIESYLTNFNDIEALILGCTHYPLIKSQIMAYFDHKVRVLDSSRITARFVYDYLKKEGKLSEKSIEEDQFLVSDYTTSFEASTKLFFDKKVKLEKYSLWE